jgi:hypothetical protein
MENKHARCQAARLRAKALPYVALRTGARPARFSSHRALARINNLVRIAKYANKKSATKTREKKFNFFLKKGLPRTGQTAQLNEFVGMTNMFIEQMRALQVRFEMQLGYESQRLNRTK